jgi:hypothetical protein
MRKLWYAGAAIAGGIFLFGATTPAQADLLPGTDTAEQQADQQLTRVLGEPNGVNVENPLRYSSLKDSQLGGSPVMRFKAGNNSPDLNPMLPGEVGDEPRPGLEPAADVVGDTLRQQDDQLPVRLPVNNLFGSNSVPLLGNLLPSGDSGTGSPIRSSDLDRPTAGQSESFEGGMPLLGGLGGLLPVNSLPRSGDTPDVSGMPAGGMTVTPAASKSPALASDNPALTSGKPVLPAENPALPAQTPAKQRPKPAATPDDPRLHEEPIDGERDRAFSADARPIAGVDQQYR